MGTALVVAGWVARRIGCPRYGKCCMIYQEMHRTLGEVARYYPVSDLVGYKTMEQLTHEMSAGSIEDAEYYEFRGGDKVSRLSNRRRGGL